MKDFFAYWEAEGALYVHRGDYDWMAGQSALPGAKRVLEIGCGLGFGTESLIKRGLTVLAVDMLPEALAVTKERVEKHAGQNARTKPACSFLKADMTHLEDEAYQVMAEFKPEIVVCWLMGAPQEVIRYEAVDPSAAVAAYREKTHRQIAELAAGLPGLQMVHLIDRTVIPWQAKELGRETLLSYHLSKTFSKLPFTASLQDAQYRKLETSTQEEVGRLTQMRKSHPALKSATPVLSSLTVWRQGGGQ